MKISGQNSPYIFTKIKLRLDNFDNDSCHGHMMICYHFSRVGVVLDIRLFRFDLTVF